MNRHLLRRALRLPQAAIKRLVTGLLQIVLLANRPARLARSGFVLPTTVLLVLMVVLTATALTYRSFTRSDMAISQREQQVIANAATPALDRARAKIEFLFNKDTRLSSGLPNSDFLASMMLATPTPGTGVVALLGDPFTLPGETRLDINNDTKPDNAWSFVSDANGETIVYSILVDDEGTKADPTATGSTAKKITDPTDQVKASALITRTGPLATTTAGSNCPNARAEAGWQAVNTGSTAQLQKNFQINVFVPNANNANRTVEAFEFQQSRIANRGNKWAAWFRYDMEVYPGRTFNINGAMHTDGNLMVDGEGAFTSYMISSHNSCVYSKLASEVTVGPANNGFEGQIVKGVTTYGGFGSKTGTANFHVWTTDNTAPVNQALTTGNDSVNDVGSVGDLAANPLVLFTQDRLQHTVAGWNNRNNAAWNGNAIKVGERVLNKKVTKPFVDDFSRADNRWGPKPRYSDTNAALNLTSASNTNVVGDNIASTPANELLRDPIKGLDGYWERQAVKYGLRLVVGERLQLGNPREWNFNPATNGVDTTNFDRIYPPNATTQPTVSGKVGANEFRQKRTLRDNLAAVQGMVVYHHETLGGEFPAACMAMTAHPGSPQSIINSRTFRNYPNVTVPTPLVKTDFLRGEGTNGWEFQFPAAFNTPTTFATEIADGQPLGIALRNLARFAGDPKGGAPSFKPFQDTDVHPAPFLSMWGDFSPLRRIFTEYLDNSVPYSALSAADKATLHSAACTVSMLAYNVNSDYADAIKRLENYTPPSSIQNVTTGAGNMVNDITNFVTDRQADGLWIGYPSKDQKVGDALTKIGRSKPWVDPSTSSVCTTGTDAAGFQAACDSAEFFEEFTLDNWISLLTDLVSSLKLPEDIDALKSVAEEVNILNSLVRDRDLGFRTGLPTIKAKDITPSGNAVNWIPTTGLTEAINPQGSSGPYVYKTGCNPNIFSALGAGGGGGKNNVVMAALLGCSKSTTLKIPVRYPSLYYLFPVVAHDHDGAGYHQQPDGVNLPVPSSPLTPPRPQLQVAEEYITNAYVKSVNPLATEPVAAASATYRVVGTDPITGISEIAAVPRALSAALNTWKVPVETGVALSVDATPPSTIPGIDTPAQAFSISTPGGVGAAISVPFLDKGMFDGREQMAIRTLDINLERLTNRQNVSDYWLPDVACNPSTQDCDVFTEGIVYAFREDAVREDEIVRPKTSAANSDACLTVAQVIDSPCRMVTTLSAEKDPPLTPKLISLKPVDFVADPDRRPHGFRLRNGIDMSRQGTVSKKRNVGMTFVTDNSVYVLGDFNLHSTDGTTGTLIEEFNTKIGNINWDLTNFYGGRTVINPNFAKPLLDTWRPVEILADAFTILSGGFIDGAAVDTFTKPKFTGGVANVTVPLTTNTSYMNQSRPDTAVPNLVREGGADSPVWINRNGSAFSGATEVESSGLVWTGTKDSNVERGRNSRLVTAPNTYVNAVFIGGIVPSRLNQSYGGLQNFPRMLELWEDLDGTETNGKAKNLNIAGAFFQLNFATAATGPYDHDAWQPGAGVDADEFNGYYRAPARRWGYDPGLLYYPPAAAARRFVSVDTPRSEYYRELPADDPYIVNLRCAKSGTTPIFDASIQGTCPT